MISEAPMGGPLAPKGIPDHGAGGDVTEASIAPGGAIDRARRARIDRYAIIGVFAAAMRRAEGECARRANGAGSEVPVRPASPTCSLDPVEIRRLK